MSKYKSNIVLIIVLAFCLQNPQDDKEYIEYQEWLHKIWQ